MKTKEILADKVRQLRALQGKSQLEFAEDVGISKTELIQIEGAQANVRLDTLEQLAKAFSCTCIFSVGRGRGCRYLGCCKMAADFSGHCKWAKARRPDTGSQVI